MFGYMTFTVKYYICVKYSIKNWVIEAKKQKFKPEAKSLRIICFTPFTLAVNYST